mmetsp:Transcript_64313/g.178043  ORF Transcript_64313/g.178043 Transcript_64313/m.178043 type:complete len:488 (-) Transcript_64313:7-1470(-)
MGEGLGVVDLLGDAGRAARRGARDGGGHADLRHLELVDGVRLLDPRVRVVVVPDHNRQVLRARGLGVHARELAALALLERVAVHVLIVPEVDTEDRRPVDLDLARVVVTLEPRVGAPVVHRAHPVRRHGAREVRIAGVERAAAELAVSLRLQRGLGRVDEGTVGRVEDVVARRAVGRAVLAGPRHIAARRVHEKLRALGRVVLNLHAAGGVDRWVAVRAARAGVVPEWEGAVAGARVAERIRPHVGLGVDLGDLAGRVGRTARRGGCVVVEDVLDSARVRVSVELAHGVRQLAGRQLGHGLERARLEKLGLALVRNVVDEPHHSIVALAVARHVVELRVGVDDRLLALPLRLHGVQLVGVHAVGGQAARVIRVLVDELERVVASAVENLEHVVDLGQGHVLARDELVGNALDNALERRVELLTDFLDAIALHVAARDLGASALSVGELGRSSADSNKSEKSRRFHHGRRSTSSGSGARRRSGVCELV